MASLRSVGRWDDETDVLVAGYGVAGCAAAIAAHDADPQADVLVVEKMPEAWAGGDVRETETRAPSPASDSMIFTARPFFIMLSELYWIAVGESNVQAPDLELCRVFFTRTGAHFA